MKITIDEAVERALALIREYDTAIPGRVRNGQEVSRATTPRIRCEWEPALGYTAKISVEWDLGEEPNTFIPCVRVGWSLAPSYTPAEARACVVLHAAVTDLACLVETMLTHHTIIYSHDSAARS